MTLVSCSGESPPVIHDLSDASFEVLNQDSASVTFPDDFEGDIVVAGFIYTHCPDVCPIITANLKNISQQVPESRDIHFLAITFDPERDTPSVLKTYMKQFDLNPDRFTMLTADTMTMDSLLTSLDIKAEKVSAGDRDMADSLHAGHQGYTMNHTNRILVMDPEGRVRFEYPGSVVPPEMVLEDIAQLE